ncbi:MULTISPECIES: flagellar basal body P-ring formation chaperone FlgA [unclassified Leisingera]|uniref:flagellar basal body P-ring formation chaperone FlgA n=1 Tax=unclassified Leisingera TaxID=2614906 RepID=UPI0002D567AE|nr:MULTISPECIES: flagellar basal body P-ring formation chaperone FlgA [unclassified Leisingera]KIC18311.1 flagellar basal body P-ring biosynthesis protein FlgA [Leisingera sp. ANG-DT]KIC24264.1 flagellar basal body P-ring biosynthesis protein FlgA [Leisingera sp. ANG-S3]KIC27944.1 flagellar basal body P-ring biosynthesis protein FlgA [Leisingera sp. ANG-M6]KIC32979.1 flagellar basal body P-ring biosynthesis protein FlgA [Leisingera sp. ANG-S5]KIC52980.1 flagellar basal body P-ring biosynthesis
MKLALACLTAAALCTPPAWAEYLVPLRTIRAKAIVNAEDLALKKGEILGALSDPSDVIGMEARVALYAGRPMRPGDIGPPAIVERNDLVTLIFRQGGLTIAAEGRALGRGAAGEALRVMNLSSRTTVTGRITNDGSVEVN